MVKSFSNIVNLKKRFRQALWVFFIFAPLACCNAKRTGQTARIAKAVPPVYANAANGGFYRHQDTLYLAQKRFSGHIYSLYPNSADSAFAGCYLNGLEEGPQKKWYPNGQLGEQRFYISGKKEGVQQSWWPNGKQKFVYTAVDDVYDGELKEWAADGLLYRDFNYVNGQEEGSERMWWANGTVRANYVVHNGKRYGLLGMKVCKNPYDSLAKQQ